MLSYQFGIKTLSPGIIRNNYTRSGNESRLRGKVFLKNRRRVTMYKVRLTKLILYAHFSLSSNSITCNKLFGSWFCSRMYIESMITDPEHCSQQFYVKQQPTYIYGGIQRTMGHPKRRKSHGDGDSVRESSFKRFSSVTNISEQSCVRLKDLMKINKNNKDQVNDKLIHIVADYKVLILAYKIIKNNSNNFTHGINSPTLNKTNINWIVTVSQQLKAGKYKFKPVFISKPKKKGEKSLTYNSTIDKVVQQAIYLVLNAVYEPSFLNSFHGSRLNKGPHTALKDIKSKFQNVKWCIKANIKENFYTIDHKTLLIFLSKRIICSKFLALIKKLIKIGYLENNKFVASNKGLSQNNIISFILKNIYFYQLDLFMFTFAKSFNKGENYKNLCKIKNKNSFNPNLKRLNYIRYEDEFVVGIEGSHNDTIKIRNKINGFLKNDLKLTLNYKKMSITCFSKKSIFFLGTFIKVTWKKDKKIITFKKKYNTYNKVQMIPRIVMKAPIKLIFKKAALNGFFKIRQDKFIPTKVGRCINLNHQNILRYYNSIISGLINFYSFANNRQSFRSLIYGLKLSCARTLALKYKLRHVSKIYKRFGPNLESPDGKIKFFSPNSLKSTKKFNYNISIPNTIILSYWNNKLN